MRRWPALAVALVLPGLSAAQAPTSRAHMEGCLTWQRFGDGSYGAFNQCNSTIAVKFMALADRRVIEGEVAALDRFVAKGYSTGGMIFTACPKGYEPSLRFATENAEQIAVSLYNCLPTGRPDS